MLLRPNPARWRRAPLLSAANPVKPAARPFGLVARHGQVSQFTHDRQNMLYSRRSGVAQVG
jgi:hypothetical protein